MSRTHGFVVAVLLGYGGLLLLALVVNLYAAGLALLTLLLYILAYTPLKPISTLNTIVGAVVGGIPPIIGWVAVREQIEIQAWILGALLFVWQLPHFLSLASDRKCGSCQTNSSAPRIHAWISICSRTATHPMIGGIPPTTAPTIVLSVLIGFSGVYASMYRSSVSRASPAA